MLVHLDTDFLVHALSRRGLEWERLVALARSDAQIQMSAIAWYEFGRGPRTPEQMAVARSFFFEDGIVPFSEALSERAAAVFRLLGSPRRHGADIAIGVTACVLGARLLTRNGRHFGRIPELEFEVVCDDSGS
ncbi:MAG: type II toxin-antitoxin system VapC family toxin [Deltaproteobacteria bacterium]|nr:type II toxin-antitoxin system VapC family toxin [Deltaproteobacteria bacterium]